MINIITSPFMVDVLKQYYTVISKFMCRSVEIQLWNFREKYRTNSFLSFIKYEI